MIDIVTIVGARPQFVKAAVISRGIRERFPAEISEFLVHTGQHYDRNMSQLFFDEMDIPLPDINLEIGSGAHGSMTGRMLESIEKVLIERSPDAVLVYGDTNSTLAGALAASKLLIPVVHVEAGLRSFDMSMPEEQNRRLTDHISGLLCCPTERAVENLREEGITSGVSQTGDVMYDASLYYRERAHEVPPDLPAQFFLVTIHRAENTDDLSRLSSIVEALNDYDQLPAVFPMHPRTRKVIDRHKLKLGPHIHVIEPVGFLDMIALENACEFVVTDSGGLQKEAYFFQKPCITLRDTSEWTETVKAGANVLVGADRQRILKAMTSPPIPLEWKPLYGAGRAAERILQEIVDAYG